MGSSPTVSAEIKDLEDIMTEKNQNIPQPAPKEDSKSKYRVLHERGVELDDESIDFIVATISEGFTDTCSFLGRSDGELHFICSDNLRNIGYVPNETGPVNIPLAFFKDLEQHGTKVDPELPFTIATISGKPYQIGLRHYLISAGREEAVHYFQHRGDTHLRAEIDSDGFVEQLSPLDRLSCDVEVEARSVVDKIARTKGEPLVWERVDAELRRLFPDKYGKSVNELLSR